MTTTSLEDDPVLAELVRRLVGAFDPDRTHLFGSKARGDRGPDSDYDLMVVVDEASWPAYRMAQQTHSLVWDLGTAADILVWTREAFDGRLHLKASLPATIVHEGKLLYAAWSEPRRRYPSVAPQSEGRSSWRLESCVAASARLARMDRAAAVAPPVILRSAATKNPADWRRQARCFASLSMTAAGAPVFGRGRRPPWVDLAADPPLAEDALFHCQQAVERAPKGFPAWHDRPFRKTHDLAELGRQVSQLDPSLESACRRAEQLTVYAWVFRYPGEPGEPTVKEAEGTLALAHEVCEAVLSRLPAEAHP